MVLQIVGHLRNVLNTLTNAFKLGAKRKKKKCVIKIPEE